MKINFRNKTKKSLYSRSPQEWKLKGFGSSIRKHNKNHVNNSYK